MSDLVPIVDTAARVFWCTAHMVGFLYIFRCWRLERRRFYGWFAASWGLMALRSLGILTLSHVTWVHLVGSVFVSPASSICGLIGFRMLFRYVTRRIATIRRSADGEYVVRRFDEP